MIILVEALLKLAAHRRQLGAVIKILLSPHSTSEAFLKNWKRVRIYLLYFLIKETNSYPLVMYWSIGRGNLLILHMIRSYFETLFTYHCGAPVRNYFNKDSNLNRNISLENLLAGNILLFPDVGTLH